MKCDQMHSLMIDYLYDEISDKNRGILESHLATCEKCSAEINTLKSTSKILQKWEDVEPDFNLVMVSEKVTWLNNLKEKLEKSK